MIEQLFQLLIFLTKIFVGGYFIVLTWMVLVRVTTRTALEAYYDFYEGLAKRRIENGKESERT